MDLLTITVSLVLLMIFAYRGYSIILFAPLFAMIAAIGSGYELMSVNSEIYMTKVAEYVKAYYPIFLLGAVFAKTMERGGLASAVAAAIVHTLGKDRAILAVLLGCGVLTYGGLSVFVVAFVMYPFAAVLFRQADIPKKLIPATLWMGIFTYAMVALPGTPQIQNIIPTTFFGTSTWAGPVTGVVGAVGFFTIGLGWIGYRQRSLAATGEGYGDHNRNEPQPMEDGLPTWWLAIIPLLVVILMNLYMSNPFQWSWAYHWDAHSLDAIKPLNISLLSPNVARIQAIWSLDIALALGIVFSVFIGWRRIRASGGILSSCNEGAKASVEAILNTASGYAFGAVIASLAGFQAVKLALLHLNMGKGPLLSEIITTNVMVAFTGSSSGGITIALNMLGGEWLAWAQAVGMPAELVHRIACLASAGLDTVPHGGALVTLIAVCGLTHREAYYDMFMLTLMKVTISLLGVLVYIVFGWA